MSLRHYAAGIIISAGVYVTGLLWWQRADPYIAAEDVAAIAADIWERNVSFFATPVYNPESAFSIYGSRDETILSFRSNVVGTVRSRTLIEQMTSSLKRHLIPAHLNYPVGPGVSAAPSPVHWLPTDNDLDAPLLSEPPRTFRLETVPLAGGIEQRTWVLEQAGANVTPHIITLDTRNVDADSCFDTYTTQYVPGVSDFLDRSSYDVWPMELITGIESNSWWTQVGLGYQHYVWPGFEKVNPLTKAVSYSNHVISTNTLNNLLLVVSNMNSMVMITTPAKNAEYWICSSNSHRSSRGTFTRYDFWADEGSGGVYGRLEPWPEGFHTDMIDELYDDLDSSLNGNHTPVPGNWLGYPLAVLGFRITGDGEIDSRTYGGATTTRYLAHINVRGFTSERMFLNDVQCTWPYPWMYASNMISRVRYYGVFGVAGYDDREDLPSPIPNQWEDAERYWTSTPVTYEMVNTDEFCGYPLSLIVTNYPKTLISTSEGYDRFELGSNIVGTSAQWIPVLLADEDNPSEAPKVNLGPEYIDFSGHWPRVRGEGEYLESDSGAGSYTEGWTFYWSHFTGLKIKALLCVVDLNFSNYSLGHKGEAYTPPWATDIPTLTP